MAMARVAGVSTTSTGRRPTVRGRYLHADDRKLYVRGVTYGTFAPDEVTGEVYDPELVERDFAAMAANGINAVRTYTVPPRWLLDLAAARTACWVMVGLPWEQHVTFLDDRARAAVDRASACARACAPAPAIRRSSATRSATRSRRRSCAGTAAAGSSASWSGSTDAAKDEDPAALVTYVNYPDHRVPPAPVPRLRLLQRLPRGPGAVRRPTSPGCRTSPATARWS